MAECVRFALPQDPAVQTALEAPEPAASRGPLSGIGGASEAPPSQPLRVGVGVGVGISGRPPCGESAVWLSDSSTAQRSTARPPAHALRRSRFDKQQRI